MEFKDGKFLTKEMKIAFAWSVVIGLLCHFAYITGMFFNEDSISTPIMRNFDTGISQGRWASGIVLYILRKGYSMQAMIGIVSVLAISAQNAILTEIFELKNKFSIFLWCFVLMAMPSLAYTSCYVFSFDIYGIELFISALCVYMVYKVKKGIVPAMFLMMFNLALYQATLAQIMTLCVLILLRMLVKGSAITDVMKQVGSFVVMGIGGIIFYLISVKVSVWIYAMQLSGYKGISGMGNASIVEYLLGVPKAYIDFADYFFGTEFFYASTVLKFVYAALLIGIIGMSLWMAWNVDSKQRKWRSILTVVALLLLPLCVNIIDIVAPDTGTYTVIVYAMGYVIGSILLLLESLNWQIKKEHIRKLINVTVVALLVVISWNYVIIDNAYYTKAKVYTERTREFYSRVLSEIESAEGYESGLNLIVLGSYPNRISKMSESKLEEIIINDSGLRNRIIGLAKARDYRITEKVTNYLVNICGADLVYGFNVENAERRISKVLESEEYTTMGIWPAEDSVKVINDFVVVNLRQPFYIRSKVTSDGMGVRFEVRNTESVAEGYSYLWRVYKDGEEIYRSKDYQEKSSVRLNEVEPGKYYARCYIKNEKGRVIEDSLYSLYDISVEANNEK